MTSVTLYLIRGIHVALIAYIIAAPFVFHTKLFLLLHCCTCIALIVHWLANDDTCILTILESRLLGKDKMQTFSGRLMSQIYTVPENSIPYYTILMLLIGISFFRITNSSIPWLPNSKNKL